MSDERERDPGEPRSYGGDFPMWRETPAERRKRLLKLRKCRICPNREGESYMAVFIGDLCHTCFRANNKRAELGLPPLKRLKKPLPYFG